ncbi:MAG TPA: hypothetical protein VFA43_22210 [Gemmatimonadaceae bacterium]|nr:hypothetical protein [Gemmatimonadaceae bacterium]
MRCNYEDPFDRRWAFGDHDPLPTTRAGCLREILARAVEPYAGGDLLLIDRRLSKESFGLLGQRRTRSIEARYLVEPIKADNHQFDQRLVELSQRHGRDAIQQAAEVHWSLVRQIHSRRSVPLPDSDVEWAIQTHQSLIAELRIEIVAIDCDDVPKADAQAMLNALSRAGHPALVMLSGAIPGMFDGTNVRIHTGWRVWVIAPRRDQREQIVAIARQYRAHVVKYDRVPGSGYKTIATPATGWRQEAGFRYDLDGSHKRRMRRWWTVERLQEVVKFLRLIPELSAEWYAEVDAYYESWRPAANPTPVSTTGIPEPTLTKSSAPRTAPMIAESPVSQKTARSLTELPNWLSRLLVEGDHEGRYQHPSGGTDRSRLGFALILSLQIAGWSAEDAWPLVVEQRLRGFAKFHDRAKQFFLDDWHRCAKARKIPSSAGTKRKERTLRQAMDEIDNPVALSVFAALLSFPGDSPAPGYRRLGERAGCDKQTAWETIQDLIALEYVKKRDPIVLPHTGRDAQSFEILLVPPAADTSRLQLPPSGAPASLLPLLLGVFQAGVPFRWGLRAIGPPSERDLAKESAAEILLSMGEERLSAKRWLARTRQQHQIERDAYRHSRLQWVLRQVVRVPDHDLEAA